MTKTKLMNRLTRPVLAAAALGLVSASPAGADYLSHRSAETFFAREDFETPWVPRKGKMSYEQDRGQPEYGQGRSPKRTVSCKNFPKFVGPGGGAKHGDTVMVKPGKSGTCDLGAGIVITTGVEIVPYSNGGPSIVAALVGNHRQVMNQSADDASQPFLYDAAAATEIGKAYKLRFTCNTATAPCISVNVAPDKTVTIKNTHIKTVGNLNAPLIESRSGGLVLVNNFIEATPGAAPAILVHGSRAAIVGNLVANAAYAIKLLPTQVRAKDVYKLESNIIAATGVSVSVDGAGTLALTNNIFEPGAETLGVHVIVANGTAMIDQNVFRNAKGAAILNAAPRGVILNIDRNLFESNTQVVTGIGGALAHKSPFPTGNICKNQPFASFYNDPPHYTGYLNTANGQVDYVFSGSTKKPSVSKIKRSRRKADDKTLWANYDAYLATAMTKINSKKPEFRTLDTKRKPRRTREVRPAFKQYPKQWWNMWGVFKAFHFKQRESVGAHVLFDRFNISSEDGYSACFDYSTLYKFGTAPDRQGS